LLNIAEQAQTIRNLKYLKLDE